MRTLVATALNIYAMYINFLNNISSRWGEYKAWAFEDGEVVYHAYLDRKSRYTVDINKDTFWYTLWALLLKTHGLQLLRTITYTEDLIDKTANMNLVCYYDNGEMVKKVCCMPQYNKGRTIEATCIALPKLYYVILNDKFDVTKEYESIRESLAEVCKTCDVYVGDLNEILFMYKYRHSKKRYGGIIYKMACLREDTYKEYVFKAHELFDFTNKHGTTVPQ